MPLKGYIFRVDSDGIDMSASNLFTTPTTHLEDYAARYKQSQAHHC